MPIQDRQGFIKDARPNMTYQQKNGQLGAALQNPPWARRKIIRIDRIEISAQGWRISYRTGTP